MCPMKRPAITCTECLILNGKRSIRKRLLPSNRQPTKHLIEPSPLTCSTSIQVAACERARSLTWIMRRSALSVIICSASHQRRFSWLANCPPVCWTNQQTVVRLKYLSSLTEAETTAADHRDAGAAEPDVPITLILQLDRDNRQAQQLLGRAALGFPHRVLVHCQQTPKYCQ